MNLEIKKAQIIRRILYIDGKMVFNMSDRSKYVKCSVCYKHSDHYYKYNKNSKYVSLCEICYDKLYFLVNMRNG